jgi:hypothetical protein
MEIDLNISLIYMYIIYIYIYIYIYILAHIHTYVHTHTEHTSLHNCMACHIVRSGITRVLSYSHSEKFANFGVRSQIFVWE